MLSGSSAVIAALRRINIDHLLEQQRKLAVFIKQLIGSPEGPEHHWLSATH